jgi:hypothetical protein
METPMMTPPPVSGADYPTEVGAEARTNYLSGGLTTTTAYINNLYPGGSSEPLAEATVSVLPTIAYDATTARQHATLSYSLGYTFYQPTSELNELDNAATFGYKYRLTKHMTFSATERFEDSSTPFNPGYAGGAISGGQEPSTPGVIPPFAKRLTNFANLELTMQTGPDTMFGGSGVATQLHYPNPAQSQGLYDSSSRGGTGFYNRRITRSQYFGATYQYLDMSSKPPIGSDTTQTQTIAGFYTFAPKPALSFSISAGPQYYRTVQTPLPAISAWEPYLSASMGWQGIHTSFAASYSQAVTGGGGLLGAYHSKSTNAAVRWKMTRVWTLAASGGFFVNDSVNPLLITGEQSGHTISGTATLERRIGEQLSVAFHYDHIDQTYSQIVAIAANPNSDRGTISITWQFQRPLGR